MITKARNREGVDHAVLCQCVGAGYGAVPNPFSLIELYGLGGAWRGAYPDSTVAETRRTLYRLWCRGLVEPMDANWKLWRATPLGYRWYYDTFPGGMNSETAWYLFGDLYEIYVRRADMFRTLPSSFLNWVWGKFYKKR